MFNSYEVVGIDGRILIEPPFLTIISDIFIVDIFSTFGIQPENIIRFLLHSLEEISIIFDFERF